MQSRKPEEQVDPDSLHTQPIRERLKKHLPIIGILLGTAFLSLSLGPFSSWDSQLEFSAAINVIQHGMPYTSQGILINMQPLGLYIEAAFLSAFGASYTTGVAATTIFTLGNVFLTYKIGETLYSNRTGLFAAALFALAPWQLIMSRVFLVDVYCLFFSLLTLLIGIWAIRKNSLKLTLLAGTAFGLALLTKLFAVFILIPLALIFAYSKPKNLKRTIAELILFSLPAFLLQYAWYGILSGKGFLSIFGHDDFGNFLPAGFEASPLYSIGFLLETLGAFFVIGCFISLLVSVLYRKQFPKLFFFDLTCFATIAGIMAFNLILVLQGNLIVPYVNSIKYNFLTLPMLCLLAASTAKKCAMIPQTRSDSPKQLKLTFYAAWIGLYLILISMFSNFLALANLAKNEWVSFRVPGDLYYSFNRLSPALGGSFVLAAQILGFILIQLSLLWANRAIVRRLFSKL